MAKEVDLLSYWMPFLRNLREFREIAKAEEPELRYILEAIDRALANMFIETADEQGIKHFEDMMGIIPNEGDSLETRRFRVNAKWNDYIPYTEPVLFRRLVGICGSEDAFELEEHYKEYWLKIVTHLGIAGAYEMLADLLDEMLPCNLVLDLENILEEHNSHTLYIGGVCCTAMGYLITHDFKGKDALEAPFRVGMGNAFAGVHLITHDIKGAVSVTTPLSEAVVNSVGSQHEITHDVSLRDALMSSLVGGIGMSTAETRLITHDITSKVTSSGNTTVATPLSTATVITNN